MFLVNFKKNRSGHATDRRRFPAWVALVAAPLVLCISLFVCVHLVTLRQIQSQGELTVENFKNRSYGIIREMQIVSDSLIGDSDFIRAIHAPDAGELDPMALCETIRKHVGRSPYVSNAYVISKTLDTVYTENGYYMYDGLQLLLRRIVSDADTDISDGWHILNASYAPPYYVVSVPHENGSDCTTVIVTLNTQELLRTMYDAQASLCCLFNDDFSVSTLLVNHPELDWRSPAEIGRVLGRDVRCFYIDGGEFTYLAAIAVHDYYAPERTITWVFIVYAAAVALLGAGYVLQSKKQQYNAVATLIDSLPQSSHGKPSYEELLQTIHRSLKENHARSAAEAKRIERDNLQNILMGTIAHRPTADQLVQSGLPGQSEGFYLAVIHINDGLGLVKDSPKVLSIGMTCHIFAQALGDPDDNRYAVAVTAFDHNYCAVFSLHSAEASLGDIRQIIEKRLKIIEDEYGFSLRVTVSSFVPDAGDLPSAYRETAALNSFIQSVDSSAALLTQDDIRNSIGVLLNGDFIKQIQILSNTLELRQFDLVAAMVDAILEQHVARLRKHYELAETRIVTVATILAEAVLSYPIDDDFKREAAVSFHAADSISALSAAARSAFSSLAAGAVAETGPDVVTGAQGYIRDHFSNADLSIPDVCAHCGVSVQYLSRLFRERLGVTMLEYINQTRVDKAKEMLLGTDLTIGEISRRTGYNNTVTFSRNFKHYVNLSPSEYRNINQ